MAGTEPLHLRILLGLVVCLHTPLVLRAPKAHRPPMRAPFLRSPSGHYVPLAPCTYQAPTPTDSSRIVHTDYTGTHMLGEVHTSADNCSPAFPHDATTTLIMMEALSELSNFFTTHAEQWLTLTGYCSNLPAG